MRNPSVKESLPENSASHRNSTATTFQALRALPQMVTHWNIRIPRSRKTIRVDLSQWS